jgi:hypothetical protein
MARQMQRRPQVRRRDEEYAEDNNSGSQQSSPGGNSSSSVVTDLAKGFVEAQAKINSSDQEMMKLLQRISVQLENMQQTTADDGNMTQQDVGQPNSQAMQQSNQQSGQQNSTQSNLMGNQQNNQQDNQQNSQQQGGQQNNNDSQAAQELRMLFSKLLETKQTSNNRSQASNSQNNANQGNNQQFKTVTAQTAAQVLAQAQFELSKELDDSLKKLKQVISESEKLANKISSLLGEENTTNS